MLRCCCGTNIYTRRRITDVSGYLRLASFVFLPHKVKSIHPPPASFLKTRGESLHCHISEQRVADDRSSVYQVPTGDAVLTRHQTENPKNPNIIVGNRPGQDSLSQYTYHFLLFVSARSWKCSDEPLCEAVVAIRTVPAMYRIREHGSVTRTLKKYQRREFDWVDSGVSSCLRLWPNPWLLFLTPCRRRDLVYYDSYGIISYKTPSIQTYTITSGILLTFSRNKDERRKHAQIK